jgi:stalled ribosome alternative rescue factor ArfA
MKRSKWLEILRVRDCVNEIKARVNKDGLMGGASREHRVKKGKGSFQRRPKHKNPA